MIKWYHIHIFRWTGVIEYGIYYDWKVKECRCGQTRTVNA